MYLGLDLGSSYVKAVAIDDAGDVRHTGLAATGYEYERATDEALAGLPAELPRVGATGYGRHQVESSVKRTEITCLARGLTSQGIEAATLIDIGGQDSKVLRITDGQLDQHFINRRCAAGTGAYLEFLAYRLRIDPMAMSDLAAGVKVGYPISSFCTVFTSTEILDCLRRKIPLAELVRGMYGSITTRIREMAPLDPPIYLSGGVVAHHPAIVEIFSEILEHPVQAVPRPQYLAATGAALFAREVAEDEAPVEASA